MQIVDAVARFLDRQEITPPENRILVAFSGGPDSTALLHVMLELSRKLDLDIRAAHLDHGIDSESADRSRRASDLAESLGVPLVVDRRSAVAARQPGESLETAARRIRYGFLEECAHRVGAAWIATAHHSDDQRETVLLRMLFGSGIAGLAGIPSRRGRILRPLLQVGRKEIEDHLRRIDVVPIEDATNRLLSTPRNLIRHRLLPALKSEDPEAGRRLTRVAEAAEAAIARIDKLMLERLEIRSTDAGVSFDRKALAELPSSPFLPHAIGAACRLADAPPPRQAAVAEIARQIAAGSRVGCDLGGGWRVDERAGALVLARTPTRTAPFAYTLKVPGELRLSELSLVVRLSRCPTAKWMFRGSRRRAGMSLPLSDGDPVTIRSRRPGDRLQPLGCGFSRPLKEILIDRKVPKEERDRLPLLCLGETIVWVPGVTIDESARLGNSQHAWLAEIEEVQETAT